MGASWGEMVGVIVGGVGRWVAEGWRCGGDGVWSECAGARRSLVLAKARERDAEGYAKIRRDHGRDRRSLASAALLAAGEETGQGKGVGGGCKVEHGFCAVLGDRWLKRKLETQDLFPK